MSRVNGPKDGKIITAKFDGKSKSKFPSLKTTTDLVLLSIRGNEFCSGDYLGAIVKQAVANHSSIPGSSSGKTTFLIADEIYWHNLKELPTTEAEIPAAQSKIRDFKKEAVKIGDDYFTENLVYFLEPLGLNTQTFNEQWATHSVNEKIEIINQLAKEQGKNFEIVRWNQWINQNDSKNKINKMSSLYDSVEGLKISLDKSVQTFARRHAENNEDIALWAYRSKGYLAEECPSIMWLAACLGYNFIIYPGEILPPLEATKEYFIVEKHEPYVFKGKSVNEECTHNEFSLHVDDPSRLVNWLEVKFQRSHPPKVSKQNIPETTTGKVSFFSPVEAGKESKAAAKSNEEKKTEEQLTTKATNDVAGIFEGVTRGILRADLPDNQKLDFLLNFVNTYVSRLPSLDTNIHLMANRSALAF